MDFSSACARLDGNNLAREQVFQKIDAHFATIAVPGTGAPRLEQMSMSPYDVCVGVVSTELNVSGGKGEGFFGFKTQKSCLLALPT